VVEEQRHQRPPAGWSRSCLTDRDSIADGPCSMLFAAIRLFDVFVVTLIFTALT
jgi:hypothetical protein